MKLFISGEIQAEVGNVYRVASLQIEKAFNAHFVELAFGSGLVSLTYLSIIRRIESTTYGEVKKYRKKERSAEFRLKIPLDVCLLADTSEMTRLIAKSLHRAIDLLKEMQIPDFDCDAFELEYRALTRAEGWFP
jgi:hypothetical protein